MTWSASPVASSSAFQRAATAKWSSRSRAASQKKAATADVDIASGSGDGHRCRGLDPHRRAGGRTGEPTPPYQLLDRAGQGQGFTEGVLRGPTSSISAAPGRFSSSPPYWSSSFSSPSRPAAIASPTRTRPSSSPAPRGQGPRCLGPNSWPPGDQGIRGRRGRRHGRLAAAEPRRPARADRPPDQDHPSRRHHLSGHQGARSKAWPRSRSAATSSRSATPPSVSWAPTPPTSTTSSRTCSRARCARSWARSRSKS